MNVLVNGRPTLRDVARRAGVSLGSASYALGRSDRVSDGVRQRVLAAAAELGYEQHRPGRPRSRQLNIAAVVPEATNSFFSAALRATDECLRGQGHRLLVASSGDERDVEEDLIAALAPRIDGLILAPAGAVGEAASSLTERGVPVVIMDRDGQAPHLPSVSLDNHDSARRATRALIEAGHERVAIVNGPSRVSSARERMRGYRSALEEAGLPVRPEYSATGEFTFEAGRLAVHSLLRLGERPEAIFSSSAILTSGVLFSIREHGLRWPDDIAVVGVGDAVWASLVEPPITVVEQPTAEMGRTAVDLLLGGAGTTPTPQHVVIAARLVLRESHWRRSLRP